MKSPILFLFLTVPVHSQVLTYNSSVNNREILPSTVTATNCFRVPASASTFAAGCGGTGVTASTLSVSGNAFSVGGSTLVATNGLVGIGTTNPNRKLDVSGGAILSGTTDVMSGSFTARTSIADFAATVNNTIAGASRPNGLLIKTDNTSTVASDPILRVTAGSINVLDVNAGGVHVLGAGGGFSSQMTLAGSTLTVGGNAFSVGGSTFLVTSGGIGVSTNSPGQFIGGALDNRGNKPYVDVSGSNPRIAANGTGDAAFILADGGNNANERIAEFGISGNLVRIYSRNDAGSISKNYLTMNQNTGNVGINLADGDSPSSAFETKGSAQFGNTGGNISSFTAAGYFLPPQKTKAQIDTLAGVLGALIVCTDCAQPYDVCVGTGTAASQWLALANSSKTGIIGGGPAGCGSGN